LQAGHGSLPTPDDAFHSTAGLPERHTLLREHAGSDAFLFAQQTQQKMLRPDVGVVHPLRFFLSHGQRVTR